jgi:hypothetical protein
MVFSFFYKPHNVATLADIRKSPNDDFHISVQLAPLSSAQVYALHNARIYTDASISIAVINQANQLIRGASWQHGNDITAANPEDNSIFQTGVTCKPIDIKGPILSLLSGGGGNYNYYHWLFDVLPRYHIACKSKLFSNTPFVYVPSCEVGFQRETLAHLHIPKELLISSMHVKHIRAPIIFVTDHPNPEAKIPSWICSFLRETFLPFASPSTQCIDKIYISRSDSTNARRVVNEEEVCSTLQEHGFAITKLSELTFSNQVSLFRTAKLIIAPHGAGLSNLVFCEPGTKVLEIFNPDYHPSMYKELSARIGLNYEAINGQVLSRDEYSQRSSIIVDINLLRHHLSIGQ